MVEKAPGLSPESIDVAKSANRRRILSSLALGAVVFSILGNQSESEAKDLKHGASYLDEAASATMVPEIGVATTCDLGCAGSADGNYPIGQELADMKSSGIQVVRQLVNLDEVVNIDGISNSRSNSACTTANNPNFNLTQLDHIDNQLNSIGVNLILDLDSSRLAEIKPKVLKCIAYAIAKHYDGQTPGGPAAIINYEGGNEPNDPTHFSGTPSDYSQSIEAIARGIHAANKSAQVAIGGLRTDGIGIAPDVFLSQVAVADPQPSFNKVDFHIYPQDWTTDTPWKTLAGRITKQGGDLTDAISLPNISQVRLDVNNAWPSRAYNPDAQNSSKIQGQPLLIDITESGWRSNLVDTNGVSPQTQARYDGQEIKSLMNNTLGISRVMTFHWLNEPAGPNHVGGWQTGVVYESGPDLNQSPVNSNTPMMQMFRQLTSKNRQSKTG